MDSSLLGSLSWISIPPLDNDCSFHQLYHLLHNFNQVQDFSAADFLVQVIFTCWYCSGCRFPSQFKPHYLSQELSHLATVPHIHLAMATKPFHYLINLRKLNIKLYVLYILISIWVLHTPNAGQNNHDQHFCVKKLKKKHKICCKIKQKTYFF